MAAAASAFAPNMPVGRTTSLAGYHEEMTAETAEKKTKAERWSEIRLLSDEEAEAQLSGEELESFQGYHADIKEDLVKMKSIAEMMLKSLEPPRIEPKGKKQRKRDKWVIKQKIAAVRAAEE
eukprot:CAMPEP_0197233068 /NCGR_PEP_ID=MMETSP1429-20130617/1232_1 /TAXON_ID=49237 /ORGANISM="Chaetoceros  sp., Strain UNC1202" /LENGTH=121 /DNA_ID=CAMNT_0042691251 /DNA_START=113 /DNA_END=478 /DNA_ORIENTATION=+